MKDYGEVLRFWLAADLNVVVSNPDDIKVGSDVSLLNEKFVLDFIEHWFYV